MKLTSRPAWMRIAILGALVFLVVYALIALDSWQRGAKGPGRPTTYSEGSQGYKALYLWIKDLGIPIQRWEKPLGELSSDVAVLGIIQPELGPSPGELKALQRWVNKGGTLVLSARPPDLFMKHFGFEGERFADREDKKGLGQGLFSQPGPYIRKETAIESDGHPGLTSLRPEIVLHASDPWGGLVGAVKEGEGRVIAVADPSLFSNQSLRKGDHARLALDILLSHLGRGVLVVDEYHHGYGRATSVWGHLARSSAFEALLQGILLFLILWAAKGRRFGVPRPSVSKEHRSSMEYVQAMAHVFQRGQARAYALERMLRWVEEEARRLLIDADRALGTTLQSVRQHLQRNRLTDKELLEDVRQLYQGLERAKKAGP